jgi:cytochrome c553
MPNIHRFTLNAAAWGLAISISTVPTVLYADSVEEKAQLCASCHGENGTPQDKVNPVIWGQMEGYLYLQLRDFKSGVRKNDIMGPIAATLEKDDMKALAAYFAGLKWPDLGQPRAPKDVSAKAVATNTSVACTGCHLDQWQGYSVTPRLAGQNQAYLDKTMHEFRDRTRGNNPGMSDLMNAVPPDDLAPLAQYLAGL